MLGVGRTRSSDPGPAFVREEMNNEIKSSHTVETISLPPRAEKILRAQPLNPYTPLNWTPVASWQKPSDSIVESVSEPEAISDNPLAQVSYVESFDGPPNPQAI